MPGVNGNLRLNTRTLMQMTRSAEEFSRARGRNRVAALEQYTKALALFTTDVLNSARFRPTAAGRLVRVPRKTSLTAGSVS